MAGLLGQLMDPTTQGILSAGSALLQAGGPSFTPISFGQGLGQAGQAGLNSYQQAAQWQLGLKMKLEQMAELKRMHDTQIRNYESEITHRERPKAPESFTLPPGARRYDPQGNLLVEAPPTPTVPQAFTLPPGGTRFDPSGKPIASVPSAAQAASNLAKLIAERDALSPASPERVTYDQAIRRAITHQPAVNVYSGSLTAGVDAQGRPVFAQPSGREGVPPRIVPGVFPPERAADAKTRKESEQSAATVASVQERVSRMATLINQGSMTGGVVGPQGMLGRVAETARGIAQPNAPTPSLDYQNEMRLLLSDVRKIVEKDPNLSKDEREALYETLGGGIMQTPGSAIRTLNNVLEKVRSGVIQGPSRGTQIETAVRAVGWAYEPDKYEYRVMDGKMQRKAK